MGSIPTSFRSTTDFGQLTGIDPLAGLRCPEEVTGTVTIERGEPTLGMDHMSDRRHYGSRRFLLDQLRVINLTGGVVQNDNQIQLPLVLKPSMLAAVDVEQHPRNRPTRPTPPVRAALPSCGDQTRRLQRLLHPRVAIVDAVLFAQFFMKMPHVEIRVPVAIQTEHSLQLFHWNTLRTRTVMPVVV